MSTVVKIKKKIKFPLVIQGENFNKIKLLEEKYDKRRKLLNKSFNKKMSKLHQEHWGAIYEVIGQKITHDVSLNSDYIEAGLYILEAEKTHCFFNAFSNGNGD